MLHKLRGSGILGQRADERQEESHTLPACEMYPNYSFMETFVDDLKNGGYDKSLVTKARYFNSLVLDMLRNLHKDVLSKYLSLKRYLADELHLSENDIAVLKQKFLK